MNRSPYGSRPSLRSVFTSDRHIRCVFFTLCVRVEAVMAKYPGGLRALADRHTLKCNRELAVQYATGPQDLDVLAGDLKAHGIEPTEEFVCFDATSDAMICGDSAWVEVCGWLTGITSGNATYVRCTD